MRPGLSISAGPSRLLILTEPRQTSPDFNSAEYRQPNALAFFLVQRPVVKDRQSPDSSQLNSSSSFASCLARA